MVFYHDWILSSVIKDFVYVKYFCKMEKIGGKKRLQGWDLNPRPPGYEPDELPDCSTLRQDKNPMGEEGLEPSRSLYGLWILSPVCLPNSTTRPPVRDSLLC